MTTQAIRPTKFTQAKCPIRPGDPCTLCVPGATGPQDCGLVYLMMNDPDLVELRKEHLERKKAAAKDS